MSRLLFLLSILFLFTVYPIFTAQNIIHHHDDFISESISSSSIQQTSLSSATRVFSSLALEEKNKTFYINEANGTQSGDCSDPSTACSSIIYLANIISRSTDYKTTKFLIYLMGDCVQYEPITFSTLSMTSNFIFISYNSTNPSTMANKRWLAQFSSMGFSNLILDKMEIYPGDGFSFENCIVRRMSLKRGFTWMIVKNTLIEDSIFGDDSVTKYMRNRDDRPVIEITNSLINQSKLNLESITNVINSNFTGSNLTISNSVSSSLQNIFIYNSRILLRVVFYIDVTSFNCSNTNSYFAIDGANEVKISKFNFENCNNPGERTLFSTIRTLTIEKMNYNRNKAAVFFSGVYQSQLQNSKFFDNIDGAIQIENHGDSPTYFVLQKSVFLRNSRSLNGGAIYVDSSLSNFHTYDSIFEDNVAFNGGAVFVVSSIRNTYTNTIFNRNKAMDCSRCGDGGALYSNTDSLEWRTTNFTNNIAVKGGAVYIDRVPSIIFENNNVFFQNNQAQFGSDFFFGKYDINHFPVDKYANSIASSILKSYSVYKNDIEIDISQTFDLYPGETIDLRYTFEDIFGNQLDISHNRPTIDSVSNVTTYTIFDSNTNFKLFFELNNREGKSINIDLEVAYAEFNVISKLHMNLIPCPQYQHLQQVNFNGFKCIKQDVELIIISSVLSVISLLIIIPFISFILYKFALKKLYMYYKREREERRIENQLKDYLFRNINTPEEKHTLLQTLTHSNIIIPIGDIQIVSKIGEGSNGIIYLGKWASTQVALKSIKHDSVDIENQLQEFEHEASLLASLRHPNVISFYGISFGLNVQYMVFEYSENGSLDKAIHQSKTKKKVLSFREKINIILGISKGLNYLHSLRPQMIVHRDLKPGNILLDSKYEPKVTDFGMSRFIGTENSSMTMNVGTLRYCAPEIFNNNKRDANHMVDVYSFSMIMYELLFEDAPFAENSKKIKNRGSGLTSAGSSSEEYSFGSSGTSSTNEMYSIPVRVVKGERPIIPFSNDEELEMWAEEFIIADRTSLQIKTQSLRQYIELMKQCWNQSPNQRPSFSQISETLLELYVSFQ